MLTINKLPKAMRCLLPLIAVVLLSALLIGCGKGTGGTYTAELQVLDATKQTQIQKRTEELLSEPESITLKGNGSFTFTRGSTTVWEGTWRSEGETLYLLATSVMGNPVSSGFQEEIAFSMPDANTIIDERSRESGYNLVFRK